MRNLILFTYSSGSITPLKNILQSMLDLMQSPLKPDDLFYFGIFCGISQYANNPILNKEIENIPEILISERTPYEQRREYVQGIIDQVLKKEIIKPQWMIDIEQSERCGDGCFAPSTFLHILPKDDKYKELGDNFIKFLYSLSHEINQ